MQNSERHLCRTFDCVLPCGTPDPKYKGRGEFLKRKMRPAIPTQVRNEGTANPYMMGLSLMHLRFAELAAYVLKFANKPEQCGEQFVLQWNSLTEQLRKPRGLLAEFLCEDPCCECVCSWSGTHRARTSTSDHRCCNGLEWRRRKSNHEEMPRHLSPERALKNGWPSN